MGMRIQSIVSRYLKAGIGVAGCFLLGACQLVDLAIEPRTYQVNLGTQNVREELILLNVVRASRFEPLNFTALSKYTASGTLAASGNAQNNIGIDFAAFKGGPAAGQLAGATPKTALTANGNVSTGNSFDLVPLDTQDFYGNFLATLTPEKIHLLVNAGLSREVVYHSLIKSIDVNLTEAGRTLVKGYLKLRYNNDPSDDTWEGINSKEAFDRCAYEADIDMVKAKRANNGNWAPFYTGFWYGRHLSDCSYHKFLVILQAAFEYGVTTAAVAREQKAQTSRATQINVMVSSGQGGGDRQDQQRADQKTVVLCFDAAVAANYRRVIKGKSRCGEKEVKGPLQTNLGAYDASVEPVLASAYGVFQYYGQLLRTSVRVHVSSSTQTGDPVLFAVSPEASGCFAHVVYAGKSYCVPNDRADNTKQVLTLLIALVNLSTNRSSLPVTPTVLVNP
jgi:hypothetical protein